MDSFLPEQTLLIYNIAQIIAALHASQEMNFELEEIPCSENGTFYQQHNLRASRKQLIPIVKNVLSTIQ